MALSIKAKLNIIAREPAPIIKPREEGVMEYAYDEPLSDALNALDGCSLARLGLDGQLHLDRAVFLDTETTGLGGAGSVAFLVGLGRADKKYFNIKQFLMTGYACESALLTAVADHLAGCDTLITFNGKCFDAPMLESRYTMCRMPDPLAHMRHLDIIYPSRRVWKLRLKKCDLKRLEEQILGIAREGDLPGSEVPERYFKYLKSGDMALLNDVVRHNRLDVLSLGALLARLCAIYNAPAEQSNLLDLFSMGRVMERQGERQEARKCYKLAARGSPVCADNGISAMANYRLSLIHKRGGELYQAEGIWRHLADQRQMGALPLIELSKLYEHKHKDFSRALDATHKALSRAGDENERQDLYARQRRLTLKIERQLKMEE